MNQRKSYLVIFSTGVYKKYESVFIKVRIYVEKVDMRIKFEIIDEMFFIVLDLNFSLKSSYIY